MQSNYSTFQQGSLSQEPTVSECRGNICKAMGQDRGAHFDWLMQYEWTDFMTLTSDRSISRAGLEKKVLRLMGKLSLRRYAQSAGLSRFAFAIGSQPAVDYRPDAHLLLSGRPNIRLARQLWRGGELHIEPIVSVRRAASYLCTRGDSPTVVIL